MALVLCTGTDLALTETRKLILERGGHRVVMALGAGEIFAACRNHTFDVAVIGQACSRDVKELSAALIRQKCPGTRILELYLCYQGPRLKDADAWMEVPAEGPEDLARMVNELVWGAQRRAIA